MQIKTACSISLLLLTGVFVQVSAQQRVVKVLIDVDGTVIAAASVSGHPLLQAAAVNAARNARFTPTKVNGQPVKVVGVIQYNFISQ